MNFHFVMMLIVVLVSLGMHSMANASPVGVSTLAAACAVIHVARDSGAV